LERGKDSAIALYDILNNMYVDVAVLMTTYTEEYNRVSMHGVSLELVKKQAASLGLDLLKIPLPADCLNEIYEDRMAVALQRLRSMGVLEVVFGDIFLEDVRRYGEKNLGRAGFKGVFPLWGFDTARLARSFLELGFRAVICCVDTSRVPPELSDRELEPGLVSNIFPVRTSSRKASVGVLRWCTTYPSPSQLAVSRAPLLLSTNRFRSSSLSSTLP
jgi:uncharacterized protein (TIGR00290 family)